MGPADDMNVFELHPCCRLPTISATPSNAFCVPKLGLDEHEAIINKCVSTPDRQVGSRSQYWTLLVFEECLTFTILQWTFFSSLPSHERRLKPKQPEHKVQGCSQGKVQERAANATVSSETKDL